jgi:hypothetical protein
MSPEQAAQDEGGMKRFLIFVLLFPVIATASFFAVLYIVSGAVPDSLFGVAFIYLISIGPALLVALVDWFIAATLNVIPGFIATALFGYGASVLSALMAWDRGLDKEMLALGLVGAIPAAVCSWLSANQQARAQRIEVTRPEGP